MVDLNRDMQTLSHFKSNTSNAIAQMKQTGQPIVLTVDGKAEIIVQDTESYQQLLEKIEQLETILGIKQGLADIESNRTRSLTEFTKEMQQKHDISS